MIQRLSHAVIYVLDQDSAYDFYVNKLGMVVRTDHTMEHGFRWLTVGSATQPDLEIVLMPLTPSPMMSEDRVRRMRELVAEGAFGAGVLTTTDCRKSYEELSAKGVRFIQAPEERFYGIEAVLVDDSGNWFSMTQPSA